MNNKPVAWRKVVGDVTKHYQYNEMGEGTPLYLHPVKEQRCSTCDGTGDVHSIDGQWLGECPWCVNTVKEITKELDALLCSVLGEAYLGEEKEQALAKTIRQHYTHPVKELKEEKSYEVVFDGEKYTTKFVEPKVKELTDEEIDEISKEVWERPWLEAHRKFARAILRKAQEK